MRQDEICILQITPEASPMIGGVASYVENIKNKLTELQIENYIVSFQGVDNTTNTYYSHNSEVLFKENIQKLLVKLENKKCSIVVHYVSYGYHKNGLPFFLLEFIKAIFPHIKIITLFHEIGSDGPIWTKAYWTAYLQKRIAKQLAEKSNKLITTTAWYKRILLNWVGNSKEVNLSPVFSNMGEPLTRASMNKRKKTMIIFGGRALKEKLYQNHLPGIFALKDRYGIEEIIDIGSPLERNFYETSGIKQAGICEDTVVSSYLNNAWLGVMQYDLRTIDKSGVHAAYQAHGVPTVIFTKEYLELLPLYNISGDETTIYSEDELEMFSVKQYEHYHLNRSLDSLVQNIL